MEPVNNPTEVYIHNTLNWLRQQPRPQAPQNFYKRLCSKMGLQIHPEKGGIHLKAQQRPSGNDQS